MFKVIFAQLIEALLSLTYSQLRRDNVTWMNEDTHFRRSVVAGISGVTSRQLTARSLISCIIFDWVLNFAKSSFIYDHLLFWRPFDFATISSRSHLLCSMPDVSRTPQWLLTLLIRSPEKTPPLLLILRV